MEQVKDLVSRKLEQISSPKTYPNYREEVNRLKSGIPELTLDQEKVKAVILRLGIGRTFFMSGFKTDILIAFGAIEWAGTSVYPNKKIGDYSPEDLDKAVERCGVKYGKEIYLRDFMACLKVTPAERMMELGFKQNELLKLETPEENLRRIKNGEKAVSEMLAGLMAC